MHPLLQSAIDAFESDNLTAAEANFRAAADATRGTPEFAQAAYNFGVFLRRAGRPEAALNWFDNVLDLVPGHAATLVERASALADNDDLEGAAQAFDAAIAAAPQDPHARRGRAFVAFRLGQWSLCLEHLAKLGPADAQTALLVVRALLEAGRMDEGFALAKEVGTSNPALAGDLLKATTRRARGTFCLDERRLSARLGLSPETVCGSLQAHR